MKDAQAILVNFGKKLLKASILNAQKRDMNQDDAVLVVQILNIKKEIELSRADIDKCEMYSKLDAYLNIVFDSNIDFDNVIMQNKAIDCQSYISNFLMEDGLYIALEQGGLLALDGVNEPEEDNFRVLATSDGRLYSTENNKFYTT